MSAQTQPATRPTGAQMLLVDVCVWSGVTITRGARDWEFVLSGKPQTAPTLNMAKKAVNDWIRGGRK